MALLHPDKIVGVTRAILQRPITPRPSVAVAAQRVAAGRPLAPKGKPNAQPGLIENLAFQLRDFHQAQHMNRMARMVDTAVERQKQASGGFQNRPVGTPAPKGKLPGHGFGPRREPELLPHIQIHVNGQPQLGQGHPANQMDRAKAAALAAELAYSQGR